MDKVHTGGVRNQFILTLGNVLFSLLIFTIVFDPTNTILHLKDVFFVLLVAYNMIFLKPRMEYAIHIGVIFSVVSLCYVFAEMQQNSLTLEGLLAVYKSFSPLVLLLWVQYYNIIKYSIVPVFAISLLVLVLYVACVLNPAIEYGLWILSTSYDDVIMFAHRDFFGITIFAMYYKSVACFIFVFSCCLYKAVYARSLKYRRIFLFVSIIVAFPFFVSGSRSTMLLPLFMVGVLLYSLVLKNGRLKYFVYPFVFLLCFLFFVVLLVLATEKGEPSNQVKYAHIASYLNLFDSNPLYLLFGQGPATSFYSMGFGRVTHLTEWSYIEMLRNYGLFSLFILVVIIEPVFTMFRFRRYCEVSIMMFAYIAYLLIAGTNPLLLSSTGMLMILSAYSYKHILLEREKTDDGTKALSDM